MQAQIVVGGIAIEATAATVDGTGVEMEAMVAASIAALTVYDMTKALDKGIASARSCCSARAVVKVADYPRVVD